MQSRPFISKSLNAITSVLWRGYNYASQCTSQTVLYRKARLWVRSVNLDALMIGFMFTLTLGATVETYFSTQYGFSLAPVLFAMFCLTTLQCLLLAWRARVMKDERSNTSQHD